jgi:hypothetical protein
MLHANLVKALVKAGATVLEHKRFGDDKPADHFFATFEGQKIDWYTQDYFNPKTLKHEEGRLAVCYVTMRSPHTDAQTDCFCDSYRDTIKGAVDLLTRKF